MANEPKRLLSVFLCHASEDKPAVRELYTRLFNDGVDAWLDEEKILPGQDWNIEILKALQSADAIIICLSQKSVAKEGYVQREIKEALKKAEEKPSGTIFVIPIKLDMCDVPDYLKSSQWVGLYTTNGYTRLFNSLKLRASNIGAIIKTVPEEQFIDEEYLEQLFIEGRAAVLTEKWDKAIYCFNKVKSIKLNYPGASEQLAFAEKQRFLSELYSKGAEAYKAKNWAIAIKMLKELFDNASDYKDASNLLNAAKKQSELAKLYSEAEQLHNAHQWQAVIKVFDEIYAVNKTFSDSRKLLSSAKKEIENQKQIDNLNNLYRRAVKEIDSGHWATSYKLLKQIKKTQFSFLETDQLLLKVETEIKRAQLNGPRPYRWIKISLLVLFILAVGFITYRFVDGVIPSARFSPEEVVVFSDAYSQKRNKSIFFDTKSIIYLCKYDISSSRYLVSYNRESCNQNTVGWISTNNLVKPPMAFLVRIQY